MLGLYPNLRLGVDYRVSTGGVAIALTAPILAMFKEIQQSTNRTANLFGIPGSIAVDGKLGGASGQAIRSVVSRLTQDLQRNLSPEARGGLPAGIAKDARNVLGTLSEAIERKTAAVPVALAPAATAPVFLPAVKLITEPVAVAPAAVPAPLVKVAPIPTPTVPADVRFVSTLPEAQPRLPMPVFVAVLGTFLAAGIAAAVLVARR